MAILDTIKIAFGTVFGLIFLALWFFGGIIGAFIAVAQDDALSAVLSLLVPCYGAIYTIVQTLGALF